jgi:hypothetical protein
VPVTESDLQPSGTAVASEHPLGADIHAEHLGWHELVTFVRRLTPRERLAAGYYRDPDWSVRDLVAHLGTWLAEAQVQLERIRAGTYQGHDIDVDAMNTAFLHAMRDQPWSVVWVQAHAARTKLLEEWYDLTERTDEAAWWIGKAGAEHYGEHLPGLHEWVDDLIAHRSPDFEPSTVAGGG